MRDFFKSTIILQIGRLSESAIGFVISVMLARSLSSCGYGIWVLSMNIFSTLHSIFAIEGGPGAAVRLSQAYHEQDKKKIAEIITIFAVISMLTSIVVAFIGTIISQPLSHIYYRDERVGFLFWTFCISLPFLAIYTLPQLVLYSSRQMTKLIIFENFFLLSRLIFIGLFVIIYMRVETVGWAWLSHALAIAVVSIFIYKKLPRQLVPSIKLIFSYIRHIQLSCYFEFLKFSIKINIARNLTKLLTSVPILFCAKFVPAEQLAYFGIALSLTNLVTTLLGSLSRNLATHYPQMSDDIPKLMRYFFKTTIISGMIGIAATILLLATAPYIILIYGREYYPAVKLLLPLLGYLFVSGFAVGLGPIFRLFNRVGYGILSSGSALVIFSPLGLYLVKMWGSVGCGLFVSGLYIFAVVVGFLCVWHMINQLSNKKIKNLAL